MASVAAAVNDNRSYRKWTSLAKSLTKAINTVLWNDEAGVYALHPSDTANFSIAALGFAITSGIANDTQARRSLAQLPQVQLGPGYRDSTTANASNPSTNLSPNVNGFLLPGLMQRKQAGPARFLLDNLWGAMITNESTNSGASWEYVGQDSQPGYGQYTSLSHPWGGGATYALTQYVAGIRPVEFGYREWIVEPAYSGFGLEWVDATVPTPYGELGVSWRLKGEDAVVVEINAPAGTRGVLKISRDWLCAGVDSRCDECAGGKEDYVRKVKGGKKVQFRVEL
jgi:hypothetical protein